MLFSDNKENNKSWLSTIIIFLFSLLLVFLSSIGWLDFLKNAGSYVLDPIYTTSTKLAYDIEQFFGTLVNISDFRSEYNDMKIQIAQYEIDNSSYQELKNENEALKEQLKLGNKKDTYLESQVLDHIETDYITINVGITDGVDKGDVVVLGNSFIGLVVETGQYNCKVKLPISKSSFLEVYIISSENEDQKILSRAVVSGSSDGIRIENIGMNSGVKTGDVVVVNDSKVGENLVLGTVVGLSEDPATTTRTGYVSPAVDYYDLINVFVKIKNVN